MMDFFKKIITLIERKPWVIFIVCLLTVFFLFSSLFSSYFESDEWYFFTFYLPLTHHSNGLLTAFLSTIINNNALSGGQHVIPIASVIFFLDVFFFGLHFAPYAFLSLFVHAINTFLVFIFVRLLLFGQSSLKKNSYGLLAGIFFLLSPSGMHAVSGAAAFYGQNTLTHTFLLLCLISLKKAYISKKKKFLYFAGIFIIGALFTKE